MSDSVRLLVRGALLLAIGALSQQLRLVLPLPVPVMTLLIGTLVNATLVLAGRYTTRVLAWTICVALAVIAFFQGHILGPVVPVIALGNGMYVELTRTGSKESALFLGAPLGKTLVLAIGMVGALRLLQLPWGAVTKTLSISCLSSWPPASWGCCWPWGWRKGFLVPEPRKSPKNPLPGRKKESNSNFVRNVTKLWIFSNSWCIVGDINKRPLTIEHRRSSACVKGVQPCKS